MKIIQFFWHISVEPQFLMNSKILGYSVKTLLGRGSFGEVYMVEKDGEIYACKKLTSFMNRETRKALHQEVLFF